MKAGYKRIRKGKGFAYYGSDNEKVNDTKILKRIHDLVIPPMWTDVWISAAATSPLQAYGYDKKGRKQYIYHAKQTLQRARQKFAHLSEIAPHIAKLRIVADKELRGKKIWTRTRMCALGFLMIDQTLIRVGNDRYTRENKSYGLTTLQKNHIQIEGNTVTLQFVGKKGVFQQKQIQDKLLANRLRELVAQPGRRLFSVRQNDSKITMCSRHLNNYLKDCCPVSLTAKELRIWGASKEALSYLSQSPIPQNEKEKKKTWNEMAKKVAKKLGNTKTVAETYYIHPVLQQHYENGTLPTRKKPYSPEQLEKKLAKLIKSHA